MISERVKGAEGAEGERLVIVVGFRWRSTTRLHAIGVWSGFGRRYQPQLPHYTNSMTCLSRASPRALASLGGTAFPIIRETALRLILFPMGQKA
jgi:hypothetical protein